MNFEFAFAMNVGSNLDHKNIGTACTAFSIIADKVTDGDRLAWGIWAHGTEVGVGFRCECHRDHFAAIVAQGTRSIQSETDGAPHAVGLFLADYAHAVKPATLDRRLAEISKAHKAAGHHLDLSYPAVRDVRRGIRRTCGTAQRSADPITVPVLRRLLDQRDRALPLVGHLSALRRSELVALDVDDVAVLPEGLRITARRSKADQEGEGQVVAVGRASTPTCPVAAFAAWIAAAGITHGAVFRRVDRHGKLGDRLSGHGVAKVLKRRAVLAGLDPEKISGHSLRAGLATRCLVPLCGGTTAAAWRDALWDRFSTAAPRRLRRSVGQSKLVKKA